MSYQKNDQMAYLLRRVKREVVLILIMKTNRDLDLQTVMLLLINSYILIKRRKNVA